MAQSTYILTTGPAQERTACVELARLGFAAYAPSMRYQRRVKGRYRTFGRALLPGYVFVVTDSIERDDPVIRHARGVSGILAEMDEAGRNWVGALMILESFGAWDTTLERKPKLRLGEMVRIVAGQWKALGYQGKVTRIDGRKVRVAVVSADGKPLPHGMPVGCDIEAVRLVA